MDRISPSSPGSSSASDSDAVNTESARVYFGPFKTPERKFIAASKSLFPPPQPTAVRRSPRLSSPRLRSASPMDVRSLEEDIRDIEQVVQLVNESDEGEKDPSDGLATPQPGDENLPDEPSSALADRILHALDNPSPPPSPPSTLRIFDPYHTTSPDAPTDYHTDLMSLKIDDSAESVEGHAMVISSSTPQPITLFAPPSMPLNDSPAAFNRLVPVDTPSTPPTQLGAHAAVLHETMKPAMSVDDLLSQSPIVTITPMRSVPGPTLIGMATQITMPKVVSNNSKSTPNVVVSAPTTEEDSSSVTRESSMSVEGLVATPLRRSTRPRRSITPTPAILEPLPTVSVPPPPSIARTLIKKKTSGPNCNDEVVSDSQGEEDDNQRSLSPSKSETTVRVRHRSPGKRQLSFRRELGSLSPTSSNLLSTLGFSKADDSSSHNSNIPPGEGVSSSSQPMFSFSVFKPQEEPSTPARSTGAIRLSSPSKATSSSNKYRIQTPAAGDPTTTPARRIPISEGIAQGYVSPEKAAQLGFTASGTPLPSVPTPARRVAITDSSAPVSLMKSNNPRPNSPLKKSLGPRQPSTEPAQRFTMSQKGKEKDLTENQERPGTLAKLPFPLVSSVPAATSQPSVTKDIANVGKAIPAKSALKQPTSRIPRIGAKPYARTDPKTDPKATAAKPTPATTAEAPKKIVNSAAVARQNMKNLAVGSSSRVKSEVSTSLSSTLKRKRDGDAPSPVKPRVIMLRQVPSLATPPIETLPITQPPPPTSSTLRSRNPALASGRVRRVIEAEPVITRKSTTATKTPAEQVFPSLTETNTLPPSEAPSLVGDPDLHSAETDDLPPGSPMRQDPTEDLQYAAERTDEPNTTAKDTSEQDPGMNGLRRATRLRRSTTQQDGFTAGSSRTSSARRKAPVFHHDDIFSGMSITALKDLTVSNTVKNQRYVVAKLETEVIRKEGVRPESPAVKIRTIVQRQQDERDRRKTERANRRARRSGEDIPSSDVDAPPAGYSDDQMSEDEKDDAEPLRHMRGAGEEEDYETPDVHKRVKPMRLFTTDGEGDGGEQVRRRVKWDRGLFTTVYLDEVKVGTRQTTKENRSLKSILAPTAKALRLDTLGNHPHADAPLSDIVQENITVKKIVYDSDVAAAVAEAAAAAKIIRSKSKRKQ